MTIYSSEQIDIILNVIIHLSNYFTTFNLSFCCCSLLDLFSLRILYKNVMILRMLPNIYNEGVSEWVRVYICIYI